MKITDVDLCSDVCSLEFSEWDVYGVQTLLIPRFICAHCDAMQSDPVVKNAQHIIANLERFVVEPPH
jgi:hypothetical protein